MVYITTSYSLFYHKYALITNFVQYSCSMCYFSIFYIIVLKKTYKSNSRCQSGYKNPVANTVGWQSKQFWWHSENINSVSHALSTSLWMFFLLLFSQMQNSSQSVWHVFYAKYSNCFSKKPHRFWNGTAILKFY